ncbi:MAG: hypothetical protein EA367_18525 [Leptolyngbya sp. DLM2.Bin15]|nr:MAG: hypothetical protein EA367_18525 [Leptolyngbya sp. DLM2.Bin15]
MDQWLGIYWGVLFGDLMAAGWTTRRSPERSLVYSLYQPNFLAAATLPAWGRHSLALAHQLQAQAPIPRVDVGVDVVMDQRSLAQAISYALPLMLFYHDDLPQFDQQVCQVLGVSASDKVSQDERVVRVCDLAQHLARALRHRGYSMEPWTMSGADAGDAGAIAAAALQTTPYNPALALVRSLYTCDQQGIQDLDTYRSVGMMVGMLGGAYHGQSAWPSSWYRGIEGTSDRPSSLRQLWGISSRSDLEDGVQRLAAAWIGAIAPNPSFESSWAIAAAQTLQPR